MSAIIRGKHATEWITISTDEYESMKRTIAVLSDRDFAKQIEESKKAKAAGKVKDFEEVAKKLGI